ncbi:sensor domain-containing diguanylate cyclase [Aliidiomarina indica]|uniref:sensor domain-containing diguanylate cyclase n=1 Tax=Aliidiomarina indica TaxID=2749147 RepID=UPI0018907215|nr:diguanylate cyclase [Aliidiomarina indica]
MVGVRKRRGIFSRTLARRLLVRIIIASGVLIALATLIGFYFSYQQAFEQQVEHLIYDSNQRIERETSVFEQAEATAALLGEYFVASYQRKAESSEEVSRLFDDWFEETDPNVYRLRQTFFDGYRPNPDTYTGPYGSEFKHLSVFVGDSSAPLDHERKMRIVVALKVVHRLAPSWQQLYENTHISMPENALIHYSLNHPWGRQARHDLDMTQYAVVRSTLQSANPEREGAWTGLYFDLSSNQWVITYQVPVDLDGRHLGTPSHDVNLDDMLKRLIDSHDSKATHLVINNRAQFIAAPTTVVEPHRQDGIVHVEQIDNALYSHIWNQLEHVHDDQVFTLDEKDMLVIAQKITGPDWWYVTAYPLREIKSQAFKSPIRFVVLSVGFFMLLLIILYVFMNQHISRPLRHLAHLAQEVGNKRYEAVTQLKIEPQYQRSEIGMLIRSMQEMAQSILTHQQTLEGEVEKRTSELAAANKRLDNMAHIDGLTGLLNRRALHRDMQFLLSDENTKSHAFMLADVDYFKAFNDHYGHLDGDQVLKEICTLLAHQCEGRAYRYGGEEIVCMLPADDLADAIAAAELLKEGIADVGRAHKGSPLQYVTISIGVTMMVPGEAPNHIIERADKYLYQAKNEGRNCVRGG